MRQPRGSSEAAVACAQEELKKVQRRERFGLPPSKQEQAKLDAEERAAAAKALDEKMKVRVLGALSPFSSVACAYGSTRGRAELRV